MPNSNPVYIPPRGGTHPQEVEDTRTRTEGEDIHQVALDRVIRRIFNRDDSLVVVKRRQRQLFAGAFEIKSGHL